MGVLAVDRRLGGRREPPHWGGAVSRIPTRLRLTLLFAIGALMVLSLAGVFVYERFRSQVDTTIDINVKTQASALLSLISNTDAGLSQIVANPLVRGHQNFVQILNSRGEIVAATPGLKREPLLSGDALLMALARSPVHHAPQERGAASGRAAAGHPREDAGAWTRGHDRRNAA